LFIFNDRGLACSDLDLLKVEQRGEVTYWGKKLREIQEKRSKFSKMYNEDYMRQINEAVRRWEDSCLKPWVSKSAERKGKFLNTSQNEIKTIYTPLDTAHLDYLEDIGFPGEYPMLRGVYPNMYRGKVWTMRLFSGYGTPEETNRRFKYLLEHGETGLSIAFDMPTLYGYDADNPRARGEVGKCGVNISSLADMEVLLEDIPLDQVSTSMTINAPAPVILSMYVATAEKRGIPINKLRGTTQTDILKEYIAQKEWAFPPEAHLRLIRDMMVWCTRNLPLWHYISISGYHIREAGATPLQELAFTLADGFAYVELGIEAGLNVDEFAPRLSFFFDCGIEFFEEIAKFRAARRIWAKVMKEKYGAKNPRSMMLRFHTQTSGASLTWQQPLNNIIRTTIEALAAVLGGTQSLHTNAYDEAWALPTEEAALIALRTQQIIAEETGITDVVDPLGGSYYIEWLTEQMEEGVYRYLDQIEKMGGIVEAIKKGWIQREIHESAYRHNTAVNNGEVIIVGVNKYIVEGEEPINILKIDERAELKQRERLRKLRETRDNEAVKQALDNLRKTFEKPEANAMPAILEAVKKYATLGEIMDVGREVFGTWQEPAFL